MDQPMRRENGRSARLISVPEAGHPHYQFCHQIKEVMGLSGPGLVSPTQPKFTV
jgi:hypothetical protein